MNTLDIVVIAAVMIPGVWVGIKKGFLFQLLTIVSLYITSLLVSGIASPVAKWIMKSFSLSSTVAKVIACILLFIVIYLLLYLLCTLVLKMVKMVGGGGLDKILGVAFGVFKYLLVIGLLALLFDSLNARFDIVPKGDLKDSAMYCAARDLAQNIFPYIKDFLKTISF